MVGCFGFSFLVSFFITHTPPPESVPWSLSFPLCSPPLELDGNALLGFEGFSNNTNSECESDSDLVWDSAQPAGFWGDDTFSLE